MARCAPRSAPVPAAALTVAVFLQPLKCCGQRPGMDGFEKLGQLASDDQRALAEYGRHVGNGFENPVRRFVKHQRAGLLAQRFPAARL